MHDCAMTVKSPYLILTNTCGDYLMVQAERAGLYLELRLWELRLWEPRDGRSLKPDRPAGS